MQQLVQSPVVFVLLCALGAVLLSLLGVIPHALRRTLPPQVVGIAEGLAGGCMLGAGFLLVHGPTDSGWVAILGAGLGVGFVYSLQLYFGLGAEGSESMLGGVLDSELAEGAPPPPKAAADGEIGYRLLLESSMHAAMEGVAIGAAMEVGLGLGLFLVSALALHNIAESLALVDALRSRGVSLKDAAGLSIVVKVPQMMAAVAVFAVTEAVPSLRALTLGLAAGSLFYTILTDLLPAAYERCGKMRVAVAVSASAGIVVLLHGVLLGR